MLTSLRFRVAAGELYYACLRRLAAATWLIIDRNSRLAGGIRRLAERLRPSPVAKSAVLLKALSEQVSPVCFIQIGANDGVLEDPLREFIRRYRWQGVLVEPVPSTFARLEANYRGQPGLLFENAAIAAQEGLRPFYYVGPGTQVTGLPAWHAGLGSLSKQVVLSHAAQFPALSDNLTSTPVTCITFEHLCRRHHIEAPDVVVMDTEGYDFEILNTIDFHKYRPLILIYEHHHMSEAERNQSRERLAAFGYEFQEEILNTVCFRTNAAGACPPSLQRLWNELKSVDWIPL